MLDLRAPHSCSVPPSLPQDVILTLSWLVPYVPLHETDSQYHSLRDQGQGRGKLGRGEMREQTVMSAQRLGELEEMGVVALGWAEGLSSLMAGA